MDRFFKSASITQSIEMSFGYHCILIGERITKKRKFNKTPRPGLVANAYIPSVQEAENNVNEASPVTQ